MFPGKYMFDNRDFVLLNHQTHSTDGSRSIDVSGDINWFCPVPKSTVRASTIILGYIVEKSTENTSRVIYLSDGDVKGHVPDFLKRGIMEE
jgi:hypothetical protein